MEEKRFQITEKTVNAILQYMGKQPYTDVTQLISNLVNECRSQIKPEDKKEK